MPTSSPFVEQVRAHYAARPYHILPFVGAAFEGQRPELLRAVVVGINSYVSPNGWDTSNGLPSPDWFPHWFTTTKHRFGKRVKAEAGHLLKALAADGPFSGLTVTWPQSFYATNAIKVYVPEALGKEAHQITDQMLDDHLSTWISELDLMAAHDVLPHVIVVFGWRFWRHACRSFRPSQSVSFRTLRVATYEQLPGPWQPSVRLLRLAGASVPQDTLLVRLRHPSARTNVGSAQSLLAQGDVRSIRVGTAHWSEADRPPDDAAESYGEGCEFIYRGSRYIVEGGKCRRVPPPPAP